MIRTSLLLRPVVLGIQTTSALVDAAARGAAATTEAVADIAAAGLQVAALPVREAGRLVSGEPATLTRRCWRGEHRAWIEVRGLADAAELGPAVCDALAAQPGVRSTRLNRPLSRVVVEFATEAEPISPNELCRLVDDTERRFRRTGGPACAENPAGLPGDGLLARGVMVGVNAAGLGIALAGWALRLPQAPVAVDAAAALANYQPWLRRQLVHRIGTGPAHTVLSLISTGARIATLSPASLAVDLALQGIKAAEGQAGAQAWSRHEPHLARYAEQAEGYLPSRPVPRPEGAADRYGNRMALVQLVGAGLAGVFSRSLTVAATAAVVAGPKALRTTTESFAATLSRTLIDQHAALPLRPEGLRRLDRVDAVLIDPRLLCDGAARHPLATALLAEARASGAELITLDVPELGELRPAFDDLSPAGGDGMFDDALAAAVAGLQQAGRTVAVLSATASQALAAADVGLGILPDDTAAAAPPFAADLLLPDLEGAWRVLHALPAARAATERGISLSTGASAIGAVLMVPGVRRGVRGSAGPGPVTAGAAAGLLSGYLLARQVARTPAPRPAPAHQWHAMSVDEVRDVLPSPELAGAAEELAAQPPPMAWQFVKAVRAELSDPLMPVLALSSAATALLGSPVDAMLVSTVLVGNCMLAAAQQLQAENRLNHLLAQQTPPARAVEHNGSYREIDADRLLPGALIEVRSNEVVPADARLIEATDLEVDESCLTGESLTVDKQTAATPGAELAERSCMLYAGTTVVAGTALAVVTAVGPDTQARRAAELAAGELPVVGLQHQLSRLMSRAFPASAAGGVLVGVLGLLRGGGLRQALGNAIAVAVAAVPEGMPLMATLAQHASAQRLSGSGALVRIPRSVEALGRVEVVCFDKTGTLSENQLRVTRMHPVSGYCDADVLRCAANAAPSAEGARHAHATDQAVIEAAAGLRGADEALWSAPDAHLPFRSGRAFSASVSGRELVIKGAPEVVLAGCNGLRPDAGQSVAELAAGGLRVIAVAQRRLTAAQLTSLRDDPDAITGLCRTGLSLIGFLGISDTPRAEAPQLLADLADRGVGIRLITGDHPVTATAIAAELGMPVTAEQVITGAEWNALSRKGQERAVAQRVIFARMSPENKVQVVQTLERSGRVCAMVGDGANDAAAIRAASVGLGVVSHGSDSAHAVADIVLTDGRIDALVNAIDEGRRLWRGVQLAVTGLLGGNVGEVIFGVVGSALTGSSPLNNRQLLLMNMLTDALPATSVAVSTPAGSAQRVVHGIDERKLMRAVAVRGAITGAAASAAWAMASVTGRPQRAATVALITLVSTELAQTLVDSHAPLVLLTAAGSFVTFAAMISLPGISQLLGCAPVGPLGWMLALGSTGAAVLAIAAAPHLLRSGRDGSRAPDSDTEAARSMANVQPLRPDAARDVATAVDAATVWATV